ncbi:MAG: ribonuclease H-like domain-containing protein [Methanolinea sp.]|jgi:hypothetical protein|nr:ribonuclease H-like domain-containing protein [Methanolinea sp.]
MTLPLAFESASRLWRERIVRAPDYTVIRNDRLFMASVSGAPILESEYHEVLRLKYSLLQRYEGIPLEEVFPGRVLETAEGAVYCITRRHGLRLPGRAPGEVRQQLESDLTLVYGIGKRKESELRRRGYRTIPDLLQHRRFRDSARECLRVLREGSPADVRAMVSRWHPVSHPHCLSTAGLYRCEQFLFLDLETLGIYQRPVILAGLAFMDGDTLVTCQYLVRSMEEELPALLATREHLSGETVLVTYNGRTFDVPYLMERYAMYGEACEIHNPHYDLLHPSRRRWRDEFPDCRLMTLEERLFSIHRDQDVPSMMVPEFYEAFLTSQNPGPLVPVVEHNCQDLISLARLFCLFREGW